MQMRFRFFLEVLKKNMEQLNLIFLRIFVFFLESRSVVHDCCEKECPLIYREFVLRGYVTSLEMEMEMEFNETFDRLPTQ